MDAIKIFESISIILASLIASGMVIYGVNAWRREYVGKRNIELAEDVLALFYEARDAISYIRSPAGHVGEGSTRKADPNESPEEKQINDNAYVVVERYNKRQELFNKIHSMRYRYMAQFIKDFGKDSAKPFDNLRRIVNDIFLSSRMLSRHWIQQGRPWKSEGEFKKHLQEMEKYEAIFWETGSDEDPIIPRINAVISDIEAQTLKIIGKSK